MYSLFQQQGFIDPFRPGWEANTFPWMYQSTKVSDGVINLCLGHREREGTPILCQGVLLEVEVRASAAGTSLHWGVLAELI